MSDSMTAGTRVAVAIGAIKWVLIAVAIVVAGVGVLRAVADGSEYDVVVGVVAVGGAVVWSLFVWVLFGWFEHTLTALIAIARNTGPRLPGSYDVPPAPYEQHRL